MKRNLRIRPPFFEIGPKNYLYGDQIIDLARLADEASQKYDVRVIFTTPYANIARVSECTKQLIVFAPHMDNIEAVSYTHLDVYKRQAYHVGDKYQF